MAVEERKKNRNYGEKIAYDPSFKGPGSVNRSCTDVIFLFLFIVYIGLWIGVAIYAIRNGDLKKVVAPKNSFRKLCGYDADVIHKPYLMFFDLSKCYKPIPGTGCNTPQVCVEKCPDKPFLWDAVNQSTFNPKDLICQENIKAPKTLMEADAIIRSGECARYYLPSKSVFMRCLPFDNAVEQYSEISNRFKDSLTTDVLQRNFRAVTKEDAETYTKVVEDISKCWLEVLLYGIIALFVTIIVMYLLRWFTGVMTWGCIFVGILLGAFGIYYCAQRYLNYPETVTDKEPSKQTWLVLTIFCAISTAIGLLIIIFLRKRIMLTIALFEETSKSVLSNVTSLFFPLIPWLLQIGVLVFTVYVALYIIAIVESEYRFHASESSSCKCTGEASDYKDGSICIPKLFNSLCKENGKKCTTSSCSPKYNVNYLHAINGFGFLWVNFFLSAFGQMVLAGTFASWYFTFNKDDVPYFGVLNSMLITMRYHLGTLAFGSLIVAIVRAIRIMLEYLDKHLQESGDSNIATQVCLCIVKCCMSCLENVIKFINRNAYIMCAIHGTNFCTSAKDAFFLIMRNMLQVLVILRVTSFLIFVNELLITGIVVIIAKYLSFNDNVDFNFSWLPLVFVAIIAFLVASIFFTVFSMGVDTLFICFLQDLERNDGSAQKPYYMSKNLMKVFNVENE